MSSCIFEIHCPKIPFFSIQNKFGLRLRHSGFGLDGENLQFIPVLDAIFVSALMIFVTMEALDSRGAICCGVVTLSLCEEISMMKVVASLVLGFVPMWFWMHFSRRKGDIFLLCSIANFTSKCVGNIDIDF